MAKKDGTDVIEPESELDEEDISLDMTTAVVMEPLPIDRMYLGAIGAWKPGKSSTGGRKLHIEVITLEPEAFKNRKVFEDTSLDNEYGLGRVKTILMALGWSKEALDSKTFKLPKEAEVVGKQICFQVNIQKSEEYGDQNRLKRLRPKEVYTADKSD